jgi:hypothetical protein
VIVTNKRIMGIKLRLNSSLPRKAKELENLDGKADFRVPRYLVSKVTTVNAGKNKNIFVIQVRGGIVVKILIRHSTNEQFEKTKHVFLKGFQKSIVQ